MTSDLSAQDCINRMHDLLERCFRDISEFVGM